MGCVCLGAGGRVENLHEKTRRCERARGEHVEQEMEAQVYASSRRAAAMEEDEVAIKPAHGAERSINDQSDEKYAENKNKYSIKCCRLAPFIAWES